MSPYTDTYAVDRKRFFLQRHPRFNRLQSSVVFAREFLTESLVNPFVLNALFLNPLKTSEYRKVFLMFPGGRKSVHWEQMG